MKERDSWNGIEFRHLAALGAIARERSFSAAADALGYSQSAISQQVLMLERAVGQRLVNRPGGPVPVTLTAAGEQLVGHAEAIVSRLAVARSDLAALAQGAAGSLSVGCFQSAGARILAPMLRTFAQRSPGIQLTLREAADDGALLDAVVRGELDLTFVVFPLQEGPYETSELLRDPYVLLVREDSPLAARRRPVTLRELSEMELIGFRDLRRVHLPENRLGAGFDPSRIIFRSDDEKTIHALVAEGVGVAVIPWLSFDRHDDRLTVVRIGRVAPRGVGIAWHRDRYLAPPARQFIDVAQSTAAELQREVDSELAEQL
jgi:DNA-binding transcriptional LysR family regulator